MRIKRGVNAVKKRRKIFRLSKGYFGSKSKSYRIAREAVMKSLMYAYVGRKNKKRESLQSVIEERNNNPLWGLMNLLNFQRRKCVRSAFE